MSFNDIKEDVLFSTPTKNDMVEDIDLNPQKHDVSEEVLFANVSTEELDFIEPSQNTPSATQASEGYVEALELLPEENSNFDVAEEVLFKEESMVEELDAKDYEVVEENLTFEEPVSKDAITEEVLFNPHAEEVPLEVDETESAVPEELDGLSEIGEVALFEGDKPEYIERNFARKMLDSDPVIIKRYEELKNYMLTFKKVKSRVSNDFDSFNMGRIQLAKLGVSQKSLKLYLNLEYDKVETRLKCKFAGEKKAYASVPVFLRIKSDRAMRNAKYLIDKLAERFELSQNLKATPVNAVEILESKAKSYE